MNDYTEEDVGNVVSLEHVNLQVPEQSLATLFYVVGLGFTRDPYLTVGLENMWVNAGEQQFHLPTRKAQTIQGHIGLVVPDTELLQARLAAVSDALKDSQFSFAVKPDHVAVTCPWGNHYRCYAGAAAFGDMALGIAYLEFFVAPGAVAAIRRFYHQCFGAPSLLEKDADGALGRVKIGRHQSLRFREKEETLLPYDGHHIAIYVANFSQPYGFLMSRGLISEDVRNHQFRFKDIVDPENGRAALVLEHEVRSLRHPMFQRPFVNREATQSQRAYRRGWDALIPFQR